MYDYTTNNTETIDDFIAEMEEKMPKDMVITSMTGNNGGLSMQAKVESKEAAAKVIQQFRAFESVASVSVTGIQSEVSEETKAESITFNLDIQYAARVTE